MDAGHVVLTSKQYEQLMRKLPHFDQALDSKGDTDEELDHEFAVGTSCVYCLSNSSSLID